MQRFLFIMILLALPFVSTASPKPRLTSYSLAYVPYHGTSFQPRDSNHYKYSGTRGGSLVLSFVNDPPAWIYAGKPDTVKEFSWNNTSMSYDLGGGIWNTYDGSDNLIVSTYVYYNAPTHSWTPQFRYTYTYDASFNITSRVTEEWDTTHWLNSSKEAYMYSGSDMLSDTIIKVDPHTNKWVYYDLHTYSYDTHHSLMSHLFRRWGTTTSTWDTANRDTYYLNSTIYLPDSSMHEDYAYPYGWYSSQRGFYTYDGTYLISDTEKTKNTVTFEWEYYTLTSNTYSGSDKTREAHYTWSSGSWIGPLVYNMTYDGNHNMLNHIKSGWSGSAYIILRKDSNEFNSDNQPIMYTDYYWNGTTWKDTASIKYRYHYEGSDGTANTVTTKAGVQLYPNPANGIINLELKWDNAQQAVISIYDINGRPVWQWQTEKTNNYKANVPVSSLSSGSYIMSIQAGSETINKQFTMVH